MKSFAQLLVAGVIGALLLGCSIAPENLETKEFSLTPPKKNDGGIVAIGVWENRSGADLRFMIRRNDGSLLRDEFMRWEMSPEMLLQRFLHEAVYCPKTATQKAEISGTIYRFEFDEATKSAILSAMAIVSYGGENCSVNCEFSESYQKTMPAKAMSKCAERAAQLMQKRLNALVEKREKKK